MDCFLWSCCPGMRVGERVVMSQPTPEFLERSRIWKTYIRWQRAGTRQDMITERNGPRSRVDRVAGPDRAGAHVDGRAIHQAGSFRNVRGVPAVRRQRNHVFTTVTVEPLTDVHARMFAPAIGILEDPATGSASGALGAYLVQNGS